MFNYLWWDLESLKAGQIVKIDMATAANVKLIDYDNFTLYKIGGIYRFFGGYTSTTPYQIEVPHNGNWILVVDLTEPYTALLGEYMKVNKVSIITPTIHDTQHEVISSPPQEAMAEESLISSEKNTEKGESILQNNDSNNDNKVDVENIKIGIITALPKEFAAMKILMSNVKDLYLTEGAGNRYCIGELNSANGLTHQIALCLLVKMGNNTASIFATQMISHFKNLKTIIMTGIAGGIPNINDIEQDVHLGDIVVSDINGVIQYDFIKESSTFEEVRSCHSLPSAECIEAIKYIQANELLGDSHWNDYINIGIKELFRYSDYSRPESVTDILYDEEKNIVKRLERKSSDLPKVFHGKIASSNSLQKNRKKRDQLRDEHNVKAIEMEASGIADSTWTHAVGYLVIRGICDYCDDNKNDIWQNYAALAAASYTRTLIESLPKF